MKTDLPEAAFVDLPGQSEGYLTLSAPEHGEFKANFGLIIPGSMKLRLSSLQRVDYDQIDCGTCRLYLCSTDPVSSAVHSIF